jgi:predicted ferric reductase
MNFLKSILITSISFLFSFYPALCDEEPNPIEIQTKNTNIDDFTLFFVSQSLLFSLMFSTVLIKKCFNVSFFTNKLPYINLYKETVIFGSLYTIWWSGLLVYSFLDSEKILCRLGLWISVNMSALLIPVTRNSIWLNLLKLSYENVIHLHKYIAILCFISVLIKLITVIIINDVHYLFILNNYETGGSPLMGTLSSFSIILSTILSLPYIRHNFFELFYYSHRFFAIFTIITGSLHYVLTLYYILPALLLYIVDLVMRQIHTHKAIYSHFKITGNEKNDTSCIFIHITLLNPIKVNYGSYFFICFKDVSSFQYHPLSLISEYNENLIFCAKDRGPNTWTNMLKRHDSSIEKNILMNKDIYLQGPYGHITIDYTKDKYKYIFSIAGGIGITPIISVLQDINYLYENKKLCNVKKIVLIWIVKHYSFVKSFSSLLSKLEPIFEIYIYISRRTNDSIISQFDVKFEKPNIANVIHEFIDDDKIGSKEMAVICCGPMSLTNDVNKLCSRLNIDISNENF